MKTAFKKSMALVLAAVMLLCALPFTASAATYSGTCGDDLTWTLDTGVLNITGTGAMTNYQYAPWFSYCSEIKTVNIASGVTTIGDHAFRMCSLTSVTIPDSVTSIGDSAFCKCDSLTSVTIPDSVTTIGNDAFAFCYNLKNITIPDSVTSIGEWAFNNCYIIEIRYVGTVEQWNDILLDPPNHDVPRIAICECDSPRPYYGGICGDNLYWRFYNDTGEIIISGTGRMTNWSYYSYVPWNRHFSSIKSVTIGNGVTTIGERAFYSCDSLTSVTIGNSVTTIGWAAFVGCESLTSVTIPDSVTTIGQAAFSNCDSLTSITIPDSVTKIGDSAFASCDNLKDIYYGGSIFEWKQITIGINNPPLYYAKIHYYSATPGNGSTEQPDNTPEYDPSVTDSELMATPSQNTINYGDSIVLHVDPAKIPEGGYVEWYASNGNFTFKVSEDGTTCTASSSSTGKTTFTAIIRDADGNIVSADNQEMTSNANFWQKIVSFFKNLFRINRIIY